MPGCVLRVAGDTFDPDSFVATTSLQPYSVFHKGDKVFPRSPRNDKRCRSNGFSCNVSSCSGDDLAGQVRDAIAFLRRHHKDLLRLASAPGIDSKCLDFGYYIRIGGGDFFAQFDCLPAELLKLAGEVDLDIELSLYAPSLEDH